MTTKQVRSVDIGYAFRALAANCFKNTEIDRILVPSNTEVDKKKMTVAFKAPNVDKEYFLVKNGQLYIGNHCAIKNIGPHFSNLSLGCDQ